MDTTQAGPPVLLLVSSLLLQDMNPSLQLAPAPTHMRRTQRLCAADALLAEDDERRALRSVSYVAAALHRAFHDAIPWHARIRNPWRLRIRLCGKGQQASRLDGVGKHAVEDEFGVGRACHSASARCMSSG